METHWYYLGETIYRSGRVMSACGKMVHHRNECSPDNPTCEICKKAMKEFDDFHEEHEV